MSKRITVSYKVLYVGDWNAPLHYAGFSRVKFLLVIYLCCTQLTLASWSEEMKVGSRYASLFQALRIGGEASNKQL